MLNVIEGGISEAADVDKKPTLLQVPGEGRVVFRRKRPDAAQTIPHVALFLVDQA